MLRNPIPGLTLALCTAVLAAAPALADSAAPAHARGRAAIDVADARRAVRWLADDARDGRRVGTPGNEAASRWIVARLEAFGLEPAGDPIDGDDGARSWLQHFERGRLHGHNIVAVLPGSAPEKQAGHVVIGAHYDHLGHGETGSLAFFGEEGEIHNGADDNASGSAALLEIAEAFATLEPRPERSVVFVWFDAEEQGLIGSQYYVEHPRFPLRRCAAMFNLDMVGRARDGRVAVLGATSGEGLERIVLDAARRNRLDATLVPYMVPNSDHFSFYRKKVPVAFFTTGLHADYHRPSDDADRIDVETLVRVARCAFDAARTVAATAGPRPAWHEVRRAPFGFMALELLEGLTGREGFGKLARALYGPVAGAVVLPSEHGLEVLYVEPDSALAEAGVRAGDRLEAARGGLLGSRRHALGGRLGRLRLWAALTGPPATLELHRGDRSLSIPFPPRHDAR